MANLKNPALFFTTSPRTPAKMIPEIRLLCDNFTGEKWDKETQTLFAEKLAESPFFKGKGSSEDKDWSARDRITRSPKALGFVDLKPSIKLTDAGKKFLDGEHPEEVFLRQLLKFQLPSPYHKETQKTEGVFWIHPYLEILRLIRELERLTFDELKNFGLQMTDYRDFKDIKKRIREYRGEKPQSEEINLPIKPSTADAYADACFRYLRYTGLVSIEKKTASILRSKKRDVDYILGHVKRDPVFTDDKEKYKAYLFDASKPKLYKD